MTPQSWNIYWFVIPLTISISLVYAATRHESWRKIWSHAARLGLTILGLLSITTFLLLLLNRRG